jgi:signal transduction histidine kinase
LIASAQGEGIPPDKLEHIFDRFYGGDDTSASLGFGLGLRIPMSLVERQAGLIRVERNVEKRNALIVNFPALHETTGCKRNQKQERQHNGCLSCFTV